MKAWLLFGSLAIVALAIIGGAICTTDKLSHGVGYGDDLTLRMNEISCLRGGVNPYEVWMGNVDHPVYASFRDSSALAAGKRPLSCYTPWVYVYLLPINCLPEYVGAPLYLGLMILAVCVLGMIAFRYGSSLSGRREDGFAMAALSILMPSMIFSDCTVLNFGLLITATLALMMVLLERRRDVLAGLCLAFAMSKPQMTFLFLVPLLLRRKFVTLFVGAAVCVLASIPSAWMCRTSPVRLIVQSISGNSGAFVGCDLLPSPLLKVLESAGFVGMVPVAFAAGMGLLLCVFFTRRANRAGSWFDLFLPASIFTMASTYTTPSNRVLTYFTLLALAAVWLRTALPWWQGAIALFFLMRPAGGCYEILVMASGVLSAWGVSPDLAKPFLMPFSLASFAVSVWILFRYQRLTIPLQERIET